MANKSFEEISRLTIRLKDGIEPTQDHLIAGCLQRIATALEQQTVTQERQAVATERTLNEVGRILLRVDKVLNTYEDVKRQATASKGAITKVKKMVQALAESIATGKEGASV